MPLAKAWNARGELPTFQKAAPCQPLNPLNQHEPTYSVISPLVQDPSPALRNF